MAAWETLPLVKYCHLLHFIQLRTALLCSHIYSCFSEFVHYLGENEKVPLYNEMSSAFVIIISACKSHCFYTKQWMSSVWCRNTCWQKQHMDLQAKQTKPGSRNFPSAHAGGYCRLQSQDADLNRQPYKQEESFQYATCNDCSTVCMMNSLKRLKLFSDLYLHKNVLDF